MLESDGTLRRRAVRSKYYLMEDQIVKSKLLTAIVVLSTVVAFLRSDKMFGEIVSNMKDLLIPPQVLPEPP